MGMEDEMVAALWASQLRWSRGSDALRTRIDRARAAVFCLSAWGAVAGAVSATWLAQGGALQLAVAGSGALGLSVATYLSARLLGGDATRHWTRARTTSEGIKQLIYRFRARALPFRGEGAALELQRSVAEIEDAANDLLPLLPEADVGDARPPPAMTPDEYVQQRVRQQVQQYYLPKASAYARRLRRLRSAEFVLSLAATILATVAAVLAADAAPGAGAQAAGIAAWVAVLTTLGGAVVAHIAGTRYDFLVTSYTVTAHRLQRLLNEWLAQGCPLDQTRWTAFVEACESAIAVENGSWMAKWTEQKPDQA